MSQESVPTAGGPDVLPNPIPEADPEPPNPDPTPEPAPIPPVPEPAPAFGLKSSGGLRVSGSATWGGSRVDLLAGHALLE